MNKIRFGFDLGSNSIGWAALGIDSNGEISEIKGAGVRIFGSGRDPKSLASLKATRTRARQARRQRDRYLQRRKFLMEELVELGLMPKDEIERKRLANQDPYEIRARALDKRLDPFLVGRAFFHLNQRRGFKSNRKTADQNDGVVNKSVEKLKKDLDEKEVRTLGEFLAKRRSDKKNAKTVRARRTGTKLADLYELYPSRQMLVDEFDKIWHKQKKYRPDLFTNQAYERLRDEVIFNQRPLKPQPVGRCTLIPDEERAPKALPSAQNFRMYQEVNDLEWIDEVGRGHPIRDDLDVRDKIIKALEKKEKMSFRDIGKIIAKANIAGSDVIFNLESDRRKNLDGNKTSYVLKQDKQTKTKEERFGEDWFELSPSEQDEIVNLILVNKVEDEKALEVLKTKWRLSEQRAKAVLNTGLVKGHGQLSKKAIDKILPYMKEGYQYYEAVKKAGIKSHSDIWKHEYLRDVLPYYGEVCGEYVTGGKDGENFSEEKRFGVISNPTVHIALNQLRRVFNDLVRRYGKPEQVVLEMARDLPLGQEGRREIEKRYTENQKRNEKAREEMSDCNQEDSFENINRYKLWEELSEDCTQRRCPYSGTQISIAKLFSDEFEIDHILPFSKTLDDSFANKILVSRKANRVKGNKSPFEAFGHSPKGYSWQDICSRAKNLPKNKYKRFLENAMTLFDDRGGFLGRQLNDTRYLSVVAKKYISSVVPDNNIWVVTGQLTSLLRRYWGLNSILKHDGEARGNRKSRDDHRHHAIDAIVIAMTSRSMVNRFSRAAENSKKLNTERLLLRKEIDPWPTFRNDVKTIVDRIIVSHRLRNKNQGQLHEETAYGLESLPDKKGRRVVSHRVPISEIDTVKKIKMIKDKRIKESLIQVTDSETNSKAIAEIVSNWCEESKIRRLKVTQTLTVIPICNKAGKNYKGYPTGNNAYYDIFLDPKSKKWNGEIVSVFKANTKGFVPSWRKKYPTACKVMRLRINDLLEIDNNGKRMVYRVQKLSKGIITVIDHLEARTGTGSFNTSPSGLEKRKAKLIHISPSGLIMRSKRVEIPQC